MVLLYSDGDFAVCVKPAGVLSQAGSTVTVMDLLRQELGTDEEFYPVHRLDRDVSGVMVYARTQSAAAALSALIREGQFHKTYLAVVRGAPESPEGRMEDWLYKDSRLNKSFVVKAPRKGVRRASLRYETLSSIGERSLLRVELETGRFHQIRVQLASRNMPIVHDRRYGGGGGGEILLFSHRIAFPWKGEEKSFSALPQGEEWAELLNK